MSIVTYTVTVSNDKAGSRLDRFLAEALPDLSRSRLKTLIEEGHVAAAAGGAVLDPSRRVHAGESYLVAVPPAPLTWPSAEPIPVAVVFEDAHLIVVDKPAGLVVHPGAGNPDGTLVNALLAHCPGGLSQIGGPMRPGIVHRLDKDTSGLLVVAKTDAAYLSLTRQFAEHSVERAYYALVWGRPEPAAGRISYVIGRSASNRKKMAVVTRGGKSAMTKYRIIQTFGSLASVVECRPATGRTHQLRVHMAAIGHPLIGDSVYGARGRRARDVPEPQRTALMSFGRQALHAYLLGFTHPETGARITLLANIPNDIRCLMTILEKM